MDVSITKISRINGKKFMNVYPSGKKVSMKITLGRIKDLRDEPSTSEGPEKLWCLARAT